MQISQRDYNKAVKNNDAEYKLVAFAGAQQARGVGDRDDEESRELKWNPNSFEEYYKKEL